MNNGKIKMENGILRTSDNPTIPYIEGDGIGPEIMLSVLKVIDCAVQKAYGGRRNICWKELLAGEKAYHQTGEWLPEDTVNTLEDYNVALKGPLMTPVAAGWRSLNVALRRKLDLYACVRPIRWFPGIPSPVKHPEKVDLVVFRENTEDVYGGIEFACGDENTDRFETFLVQEMGVDPWRFPGETSIGVKLVSKTGSERLIRSALKYAIQKKASSLTLVHKGNIMKYTEGYFRDWGYNLAEEEFADKCTFNDNFNQSKRLVVKDLIADAFFQDILLHPERHSVVATLNLNGDYISDLVAAMVGGIGIVPGANINFESGRAIFEATHGTAPDIAGKDIANPSSLLLSGVMMLEYIGWLEAAKLISDALAVLFRNHLGTRDLFNNEKNAEVLGTAAFAGKIQTTINANDCGVLYG